MSPAPASCRPEACDHPVSSIPSKTWRTAPRPSPAGPTLPLAVGCRSGEPDSLAPVHAAKLGRSSTSARTTRSRGHEQHVSDVARVFQRRPNSRFDPSPGNRVRYARKLMAEPPGSRLGFVRQSSRSAGCYRRSRTDRSCSFSQHRVVRFDLAAKWARVEFEPANRASRPGYFSLAQPWLWSRGRTVTNGVCRWPGAVGPSRHSSQTWKLLGPGAGGAPQLLHTNVWARHLGVWTGRRVTAAPVVVTGAEMAAALGSRLLRFREIRCTGQAAPCPGDDAG